MNKYCNKANKYQIFIIYTMFSANSSLGFTLCLQKLDFMPVKLF